MSEAVNCGTLFKVKDGNARSASLVECHAGLVYALARRFEGRGTDREELIQSGFVALSTAAASFDSKKGAAFSSYAFKFVEGAMRECIRNDRLIRIPRSEYMLAGKAFAEVCSENNGADCEELAERLFAFELRSRPISLDSFTNDGDGTLGTSKELAFSDGFEDECINSALIKAALEKLEPIEKNVITLRYFRDVNQIETARILNVSQATVSRTEKSALLKLRELLCERV